MLGRGFLATISGADGAIEFDLLAAMAYVGGRGWGGGEGGGCVVFELHPGQSRISRRSCLQRDRGKVCGYRS